MKTIDKLCIGIMVMLCSLFVLPAKAAGHNDSAKDSLEHRRVVYMTSRLEKIRDMDKDQLSRLERKQLRKEVRKIKHEMKELKTTASGGIYISAGAVILILVLIIIL